MDHLADAPVANILILAGIIFLAVGLFGRVGGFIGSIFGNIEAGKNSRVLAGVLGACLIVGGGWLHEDSHKPTTSVATPTAPAANTSAASGAAPSSVPSTTAAPQALAPNVAGDPPTKTSRPPLSSEMKTASRSSAPATTASPAEPETSAGSVLDDRLVGSWSNLIPDPSSGIKRLEIVRVGQGLDAHIWYSCSSGECDYGIHKLATSGTAPSYDFTLGNRRWVGSLKQFSSGVVLLSITILEPGTSHSWHHNRVLTKSTLSEKMQGALASYLEAPSQKAFAMSPGGAWGYQYNKVISADDAAQQALQRCQKHGQPGCRVILLNNDAAE